jgi:hypothetical protein
MPVEEISAIPTSFKNKEFVDVFSFAMIYDSFFDWRAFIAPKFSVIEFRLFNKNSNKDNSFDPQRIVLVISKFN